MMVLTGTIGSGSDTFTGVFPADKCVWSQTTSSSGGYTLSYAEYIPGANAPIGGTSTSAQAHEISNPVLGFIGKSGRFVAITN